MWQVFSQTLALSLASSPLVRSFSDYADAGNAATGHKPAVDEDTAFGYFVSQLHLARAINVTYVTVRAKVFNIACSSGRLPVLYKIPTRDQA